MPPGKTLTIIKNRLRVSGTIQRKEWHPPLHLGVEAIAKGLFWLLSTTVG